MMKTLTLERQANANGVLIPKIDGEVLDGVHAIDVHSDTRTGTVTITLGAKYVIFTERKA